MKGLRKVLHKFNCYKRKFAGSSPTSYFHNQLFYGMTSFMAFNVWLIFIAFYCLMGFCLVNLTPVVDSLVSYLVDDGVRHLFNFILLPAYCSACSRSYLIGPHCK